MLSVLKISHKSDAISSSENLVPWGLHYRIALTAEKERKNLSSQDNLFYTLYRNTITEEIQWVILTSIHSSDIFYKLPFGHNDSQHKIYQAAWKTWN